MDVRMQEFSEAVTGFDALLHVDLAQIANQFDGVVLDGLQNGMAQKFEYTMELCWKTIKVFLKQHEGLDELSPRKAIKSFYLQGYLDESEYMQLVQAIDDRNTLSHIYGKQEFLKILNRLPAHADVFKRVVATLQREWKD